jgi:hypothetical protein
MGFRAIAQHSKSRPPTLYHLIFKYSTSNVFYYGKQVNPMASSTSATAGKTSIKMGVPKVLLYWSGTGACP